MTTNNTAIVSSSSKNRSREIQHTTTTLYLAGSSHTRVSTVVQILLLCILSFSLIFVSCPTVFSVERVEREKFFSGPATFEEPRRRAKIWSAPECAILQSKVQKLCPQRGLARMFFPGFAVAFDVPVLLFPVCPTLTKNSQPVRLLLISARRQVFSKSNYGV